MSGTVKEQRILEGQIALITGGYSGIASFMIRAVLVVDGGITAWTGQPNLFE
ncbi:hypothetical protein [Colwellia sp. 20A7]|uniref:hypothetical protein n=1 Tax=Colwellia sp. 20A7 TaxID=2689569 RepID=UPI00135A9F2D|nr:hypothetical protein [Colwellia sp. 20A7]